MYIVHHTDHDADPRPGAADAPPGGVLRRVGAALAAWHLRGVERRCVAELDDRMLADLGRVRPAPFLRAVRLDRPE